MRNNKAVMVNIDGAKLKSKLKEAKMPITGASAFILNHDKCYLSQRISAGKIAEKDLEKLCSYAKFDINDIIVKDEPIEEPKKDDKVGRDGLEDALNLLVVGNNNLYDSLATTNKLLESLLVEIRATATKLDRIEKRVNSIESSNGQIVAKTIQTIESVDEVNKNLKEAKSSIAIIKGRVTDIFAITDERAEKVKEDK